MTAFIKKNLWFIIFLSIFGLVGGYFSGIYTVQSTDPELLEEAIAQLGSADLIAVITAFQALGYALFCGLVGRIISEKIGLWRKFAFELRPILLTALFSIAGGCALILCDTLFFGNFSQIIKDSYLARPTVEYILASLTYGGVVEEIMLRLFFMSLVALLLMKLSRKGAPSTAQLVLANVASAMAFAAGHLPATAIMMGLTPMIVFRCFLLNGGIGLLFGYLYRKHGLGYAMLAHIGVHLVSKAIWILFI